MIWIVFAAWGLLVYFSQAKENDFSLFKEHIELMKGTL